VNNPEKFVDSTMDDQDLEALLARHKKEQKTLIAQITSLKKTVTKGEKAKRKEVLSEVQRLEQDLKERHRQELSEFQANTNAPDESVTSIEVDGTVPAQDDSLPTIQNLKLNDSVPASGKTGGKLKVNRQKARMVCRR
jgi:OTU domain-containing protein 6